MTSNIQIIGNETSVIYYNLNKQFLSNNKIILTNDILLNSFETEEIKNLIQQIKQIQLKDKTKYFDLIKEAEEKDIFSDLIKGELYKEIQSKLNKISDDLLDIQLKDYNFMSSVSNTKFNLTLRTESFSITKHYEEKGQIISAIRALIKKYFKFKANIYRTQKIDNFQIEITLSEEIYKTIFLKKENNKLLLSSSFGFLFNEPIDYSQGNEFYFSIDEDFKFYKNNQSTAFLREHNRIIEQEINSKENILTNDELIKINELTKNIHDAIIEIQINSKGKIKIQNISLLENSIPKNNSENGFIINKSTNNYDRISLITLRDNLEEEMPNPKFLIIRNDSEVKELFENFYKLENIDGIIFNQNTYNPILDYIGKTLNIDILFYATPLNKSLDVKIDFETLTIDSEENITKTTNPFSNIIQEQNKEKDEFLEQLKNFDLSTPTDQTKTEEYSNISELAQSLISSEESSINKQSKSQNQISLNSSGEKKSAIQLLAESALNKESKPQQPSNNANSNPTSSSPSQLQETQMQTSQPENFFNNINQTTQNSENQNQNLDMQQNNTQQQEQNLNQNIENSSFVIKDITSKDLNPITNDEFADFAQTLNNTINQNQQNTIPCENIEKYSQILATNIITPPNIPNSTACFVDINSLSQVNSKEIYLMTTDIENLNNPNLNYIIPASLNTENKNVYYLLSCVDDLFLEKTSNKYFLNLTQINPQIKSNVLKYCIEKYKTISLIINKEDLNLLKDNINKIENIFIKDLENQTDYETSKNQILSFEKTFLIKSQN